MIVTIDGIPVFNAIIEDEQSGMFRISLVDAPAVMSDFLAFDKQKKTMMYRVTDDEKRMIVGCVMRADFPIFRNDPDMGEFYIVFKADTIRRMAEKYLLESRQNDVNTMHVPESDVDGVQMVQYFIKDTAAGIAPEGFEDIADGSLFAAFHVVNDEVWAAIKDGTYKGFSLEGVFGLEPAQDADEVEGYVRQLKGLFSNFNSNDMSKVKNFFAALQAALVKVQFGSTTTDKGVLYWDGDEDLREGIDVFVEDAEGNRVAAEAGDYITEDGKTIRVADGRVSEIVDNRAEVAEEFGRVETDKGVLAWEGEEDLKAGYRVIREDGNPAEDGEYRTQDGKTIVVVDGVVAEIRDPEADVEAAEEEPVREEERNDREEFDRRLKTLEELVSKMAEWMGIMVVGEDGELAFSKQTLTEQMAAIRKDLDKVRKAPAAKPAHEEFKSVQRMDKTADKGLNNLGKILGM